MHPQYLILAILSVFYKEFSIGSASGMERAILTNAYAGLPFYHRMVLI